MKLGVSLVALASGLLACGSAFGQETDNEEQSDLITVTGTKRNLSIQKTETSVAVFTQDAIDRQALFDIEDILLRTANVSTAGGDGLNNLSIRGVTLTGVGFTGTGATAQVYVDGAPNSFNANQGAVNLWDIDQVEILRGPQSTVQGRNALSGAVVINTADPEYEYGAKGRVLFGNKSNRQYSGAVTGPLVEDQVAFRLSADYREIDLDVVNVATNQRALFQEALTLRGKMLIEPEAIDGLRVLVTGQYVDTDFGEFGEITSQFGLEDPEFDSFDPFGGETFDPAQRSEFNEILRGVVDIQYDLSPAWTIYLLGTIEDVNRDALFGTQGSSISRDRTYSAELRAAFDYGAFSGWFGGYYFNQRGDSAVDFNTNLSAFLIPTVPVDSIVTIVTEQTDKIENYAFFGDFTYELAPKIRLNFGARLDFETFSDTGLTGDIFSNPPDCVIDPIVPGLGGFPCAAVLPVASEPPSDADFNAFLPRGSITYDIDATKSVSFGVQRGYRAGGSYVRAVPTTGEIQTPEFDPEFITNYELAFRSQWFDRNLTVNANVFYADWTDQQVTIPGPSGAPLDLEILNAGSSELYGAEIDITATPRDDLSLFVSLGITETEFTDFPFAVVEGPNGETLPANPEDPSFANLAGNAFNSAPTVNVSAGFNYEHPAGVFTSWNVSYSGRQFSDVTNLEENEADSYTLVNGRIGYRHGPAELFLYANNLFDDRFVTRQGVSTVNTTTGVAEPNTNAFFIVNEPRLFGVQLRLEF